MFSAAQVDDVRFLSRDIRKTTIAFPFIQPENNYDLGPSKTLAASSRRKLLIFPPYRNPRAGGHRLFCSQATDVREPRFLSLSTVVNSW